MKIRNLSNGGVADVDQALADELIASGAWEALDPPKKTKKAGAKPKPEPVAEEAAE